MVDINELADLFIDRYIKKLIKESYYLSQEQNKELSDSIFKQLFYLKKQQPKMFILSDSKIKNSGFSPNNNAIYISDSQLTPLVFLHELTHLFSYNYSYFNTPEEYNTFKKDFLSTYENNDYIIDLIKLCKEKGKEVYHQFVQEIIASKKLPIELRKFDEQTQALIATLMIETHQIPLPDDLRIIYMIEDTADAIYDGTAFSKKIEYLKDDNSYIKKESSEAGHGCDYYKKTNCQFEEILANYQAISAIDPNNPLFNMLKTIIGPEFTQFLDERCQKINQPSNQSIGNKEINNNIINKTK